MTLDAYFRFCMRHKKLYDPQNRPDYTKRRSFSAPVLPDSLSLKETQTAGVAGEWIRVKGRETGKVILFIHGGSFTSMDKGSDRAVCFHLAGHTVCDVYSTNYALAPEHPFPAGLTDCFNVYSELQARHGAQNMILVGESAGGTLAMGLCHMAKKRSIPLPRAIVLFSPPTECADDLPSHSANLDTDCTVGNHRLEASYEYYQTTDRNILLSPEASPLYGDLTGFPPAMVFVSDSEVLKDDSVLLAKKMKEQGVPCTLEIGHNMVHVWPLLIGIPECRASMDRAVEFINEAFG